MTIKRFFNILSKIPKLLIPNTKMTYKWLLFKIAKNSVVLNRIHPSLRPKLWKMTGANIGKNVSIGYDTYFDVTNASLINIEDNVWITSRCLLLCHKRDLKEYYFNSDINKMPYIKEKITVKKGAHIGMGSIIMPGVTIGEGSIIGAGSVVLKDIPSWCIAAGNPAKVIRRIEKKEESEIS